MINQQLPGNRRVTNQTRELQYKTSRKEDKASEPLANASVTVSVPCDVSRAPTEVGITPVPSYLTQCGSRCTLLVAARGLLYELI